jgi:uncharacterized membrane protein
MYPSKFTPVIISSVITIILSLTPFLNLINIICCSSALIGVFAGTFYYNNQLKRTGQFIQYKDGAAIGILSGIISAIVIVMLTTLLSMIVKQNPVPEIMNLFNQRGITFPPEVDQYLQKISDEYAKQGFSITLTIMSFIADIIFYPLFGAVSGLLSVSIFSRKKYDVR